MFSKFHPKIFYLKKFNITFFFILDILSPSKANRIAAIRETAAALRERLMTESKRLTDLVQNKNNQRPLQAFSPRSRSPPQFKQKVNIPRDEPTYSSHFPGINIFYVFYLSVSLRYCYS